MTAPYYADDLVTVHHGDCLDVLRTLPDASVDAVVTDPPYGLEFMGKEWDGPKLWREYVTEADAAYVSDGRTAPKFQTARPSYAAGVPFQAWCEQWARECLRVLKPGGQMLAFGGTRTYHRLACAIEDAGFEVRDCLAWIYASGFPKSLNVGKDTRFCQCGVGESTHGDGDLRRVRGAVSDVAEDAAAGEITDLLSAVQRESARPGVGTARPQGATGAHTGELPSSGHAGREEPGVEGRRDAQAAEGQLPGRAVRPLPSGVPVDGAGGWLRDGAPASDGSLDRSAAAPVGSGQPRQPRPVGQPSGEPRPLADERGSQARRGWPLCGGCGKPRAVGVGTALKPAHEPIVLARKPLAGTVAANVLTHGTGALNIDGCRVPADPEPRKTPPKERASREDWRFGAGTGTTPENGRWPANVVLDEHAAAELDRQSGTLTSGTMRAGITPKGERNTYGQDAASGYERTWDTYGDSGGASRFFPVFRYEAKAPTDERPRAGTVAHPTVKPLDLMRWLVRLITPPNGVVLDPFLGSGTTAEACVIEGFRCIGIEREADYLPLIRARLTKPIAPVLFGDDVA